MKILFVGDSLTKGNLGERFVDKIADEFPDSKIKNLGTNGDTINIISKKLLKHLDKTNDYDFVIFQGGGNDILLPTFKHRGPLFRFAYKDQIKKGLVHLDDKDSVYNALCETVRQAKQKLSKGKIIVLTISYLNEFGEAASNKKMRVYNNAIRQVAKDEGIGLADVEMPFESYLKNKTTRNYCIRSFWNVVLTDRILTAFPGGSDFLSRNRKLHLTIDGVHLNKEGACIYATCITEVIHIAQKTKQDKGDGFYMM